MDPKVFGDLVVYPCERCMFSKTGWDPGDILKQAEQARRDQPGQKTGSPELKGFIPSWMPRAVLLPRDIFPGASAIGKICIRFAARPHSDQILHVLIDQTRPPPPNQAIR